MSRALVLSGVLSLVASHLTANGFDSVVYGTGVAGSWTTELTFANVNPEETSFGISSRLFQVCLPGATCAAFVTLPAHGSAVVNYPLPEIDNAVGAA
ncbi:MAG TPA: hypothetical protein VH854_01930 [Thermoanaerobaculia bacterium]|nr:hypothetical protein [Thermoanaerobaculia bacterium]